MKKAELLTAMRAGRAEWGATLAEIGEERMALPGVEGEWSLRDIIAHLTAYERWVAAMICADLTGATPTPFDLYGRDDSPPKEDDSTHDRYNAWVVEYARTLPLSVVLAESCRAHQRLLAAIEALPEAALADPQHYPWLDGRTLREVLPNQSFAHYRMHLPVVQEWLKRTVQCA